MGLIGLAGLQAEGRSATRSVVAKQLACIGIGFGGTIQHQNFAQQVHWGAVEGFTDRGLYRFACGTIVAACTHLDQTVRSKRAIDFLQDSIGQPLVSDLHDRTEGMGSSAKGAAKFGLKF